eukprot:TRINITY_DN778_c0_g1_i2.p1 TRINITY_DN778_c0_g1~~TRINITY_DN778_c0_g1_i2.p1  ORF type:complete len:321 (+),score=42.17 TRINITY_DN778_c0_g1_i2:51-1013(+)
MCIRDRQQQQSPQQLPYPPQPYPPQQDPYAAQAPQTQLPYPPQPYVQHDPYAQPPMTPYPPQQPPTAFVQASYPPQQGAYPMQAYPQQGYDLGVPYEKHHHHHHHCSVEQTTEAILSRDYQIAIKSWISSAWKIYKSCWWGFSGSYLFYLLLSFVPYVGFLVALVSYVLLAGWFIAAANSLRSGQPARVSDFVFGFQFVLWLLLQSILMGFVISLGFVCLIIPGLMLVILLSFSSYVFIEYKSSGLSIIDGMSLSVKMCWKKFWWITWFNIAMMFLALSGLLALGVGFLVTVPLASLTYAVAFQEIFGLNMAGEGEWQHV